MEKQLKYLNTIITSSLALSIASSFYIIKDLHIGIIKLPQLFYLFLTIAIIGVIIKIKISSEYREFFVDIIKKYGSYLIIFFIFIAINLIFWIINYKIEGGIPLFFVDLCRVIIMVIMSLVIILHLSKNNRANFWLMVSFFIPLTLTPLLFFRDMSTIIPILPTEFFTNYSLQALQYNTTSLATWIIITFSFSVSFLFKKIQEKKILPAIILGLSTIITASLIWWTSSRGALLASIIIFLIIGYKYYNKNKINLIFVLLSMFLVFFISLYILPIQAKTSVFVRYYPEYREKVTKDNFMVPSINIYIAKLNNNSSQDIKTVLLSPNFTTAQDRQNFWPKHILYILNHPFGIYGPEIISDQNLKTYWEGEHNTLLQSGKWGGWGAVFIIGLFLFYIFKISIILIKKYYNEPYILGAVTSFLGIFILAMLNSFINLKTFWIIPAMVIAIALTKKDTINK